MNRYSVLLVDDEEFVFQVIMKKMDWEAMGFDICGYAKNGIEALEKAEELSPDVVMTDIKMPYIDGLTLARRLKDLYPGIKIIIFSGFDDFEYAREAIKAEVEEYILKPINSAELKALFGRIHDSLDKERVEKRDIDKLKEYYQNSLPVLQDNFYISLIEGRIKAEHIEKVASDYQIFLKEENYLVSVLHISYRAKNGEEAEIAPFLLNLSVQKLVEEQLPPEWNCKTISYLGELVVVAGINDSNDIRRFTDTMDRICKLAKRVCEATVTAGIGTVCPSPSLLKNAYESAKTAVSYRVFYGSMRAIPISEVDTGSVRSGTNDSEECIERIIRKIRNMDEEKTAEAIRSFVSVLDALDASSKEYRVAIMKLAVRFYDFFDEFGIEADDIFGKDADPVTTLIALSSPADVGEYLMEKAALLTKKISEMRDFSSKSFVANAEEYVRNHYSDKEIGVESVCSELCLSTSYFSTTFKRMTGKTFINYLTDYRMEKAIELLADKDKKTYEIAEMVGYADPNYFSYVFKKQYGVAPSKYEV